jgi:hypothetical protein
VSAVKSTPSRRAASIFAITSGMRPQLRLPAAFRCQISTAVRASRAMRIASSIAAGSASLSLRMWVA